MTCSNNLSTRKSTVHHPRSNLNIATIYPILPRPQATHLKYLISATFNLRFSSLLTLPVIAPYSIVAYPAEHRTAPQYTLQCTEHFIRFLHSTYHLRVHASSLLPPRAQVPKTSFTSSNNSPFRISLNLLTSTFLEHLSPVLLPTLIHSFLLSLTLPNYDRTVEITRTQEITGNASPCI